MATVERVLESIDGYAVLYSQLASSSASSPLRGVDCCFILTNTDDEMKYQKIINWNTPYMYIIS